MKITGSARVQVVIEVPTSTWGDDCPLAQVYKQARDEAINHVGRMIAKEHGVRIVGEPIIIATIVERAP